MCVLVMIPPTSHDNQICRPCTTTALIWNAKFYPHSFMRRVNDMKMMHQKSSAVRKFSVCNSLFAPHRHTGRQAAQLHSFLTVALDGGDESTSCSGCFNPPPPERDPITHRVSSWVSPRASQHVLEEQKFSCFSQELNPKSLVTIPPEL